MVEKRLTDLLQEESQKFTSIEGESTIDINAEAITEEDAPETSTQINLELTVKELQQMIDKSQKQELDLQQQVSDLKTAFDKSQKQEIVLQQQVINLQTALFEQKPLAERLTKELEEAKQTILQLVEANSKLIAEINDLRRVKEPEAQPVRAITKSINPKKSHRSPERLQERPTQSNENFADNTWLYD
ncbi:hypothetical protein VB711_20335 [Cronbergia sp. UHCC 0137]|uniref:hypothetical protein n=1 Tax=Cronbergia sp. UHCC 0137 TaxID=3110239 RepID=UPI002B206DF4|nr:hypothetical protein [Cronbergia sp. UHCC 0137]MEA5620175.1 hypothetical protein [Cronbergia sp. UHCC 0137]